MRFVKMVIILLAICLSVSGVAKAQELSAEDRAKLWQAEIAADRFVERFRRTLDFEIVWRESHAANTQCVYKADNFFSKDAYEGLKYDERLLERFYIAFSNYFYLRLVFTFSKVRLTDGNDDRVFDETIFPKEVRAAGKRATYIEINGKSPRNAQEIEEMIVELNRISRLYRRYMPRNVMKTAAWKANTRYMAGRDDGIVRLGVGSGDQDCIPKDVKYYIVERNIFYFYFVQENEKMKIARFGIGS